MAEQNRHTNNFHDFLGLDYRSNEIVRPKEFCSPGSKNFDYNDQNDITKRPGYHTISDSVPGNVHDIQTINTVDPFNPGEQKIEQIAVTSTGTYRMVVDTFTVTYTGLDIGTIKVFFDTVTSRFRMQLNEPGGAGLELDQDLQAVDLSALATAINSTTRFSTSYSGPAEPASYLDFIDSNMTSASPSRDLCVVTWSAVDNESTATYPTDRYVTTAQVQNNLYVATQEYVTKYDGLSFYRAGLPKPPGSFTLPVATTYNPHQNTTLYYAYQLVRVDNNGNEVRGEFIRTTRVDTGAGQSFQIIPGHLDDVAFGQPGHHQRGARYTGGGTASFTPGQSTVLSVADNTFIVGDVFYAYTPLELTADSGHFKEDSATTPDPDIDKTFAKGRITASSGGSITVLVDEDSPNLTFPAAQGTDIDWFSNGYKVAVYRGLGNDRQDRFYLLGEVVYKPAASTRIIDQWNDDTPSQDQLQQRASVSVTDIGTGINTQPKNGTILASYRDQLIVTGINSFPGQVTFSGAGFPEHFDLAFGSFNIQNKGAGKITAAGGSEDFLMIFQENSTWRVAGDLGTAFTVDNISQDHGCISPRSVIQIEEGRLVFLSNFHGPMQVIKGSQVVPLGMIQTKGGELTSRIKPLFERSNRYLDSGESEYLWEQAFSVTWPDNEKYVLGIPIIDSDEAFVVGSGFDTLLVCYDYNFGSWHLWDGIEIGMLGVINDSSSRCLKGDLLIDGSAKFSRTGTPDDYLDNTSAISFIYKTQWESVASPSIQKKFLRTNVFQIGAADNDLTVRSEINWQEATFYSDISLQFRGEENLKGKQVRQRGKCLRTTFENANRRETPVITGWDTEFVTPMKGQKE